jgi:helicase
MEVADLKDMLPLELIESAETRGMRSLTPPQEEAINKGLLQGSNIVVAAPTASGKTFVAEMAIMKTVAWKGMKCVYIAPMRALVSEKYSEFKEAYPYLKTAISMGDLDSADIWLKGQDVIFASTEKFDSLIRHGIEWLEEVGCVVFDEVHMIDEVGRGPTLEILIATVRRLCKKAQIIALSATIGNAGELAEWLSAKLVESDYRPVKLRKGVEVSGKIIYPDSEEKLLSDGKLPEIRVVEDTLARGKQAVIFYSTKRNAEAGAERLGEKIAKRLDDAERKKLEEVSQETLRALGSQPTAQCMKLSKSILKGAAFHHSGIVNAQRRAVEQAFKEGAIKVICSTTTLGLGVNLPANTVLIRDIKRYSQEGGAEEIPKNEVMQLFGRAGRPRYDTEGRALLIAKSAEEAKYLIKKYISTEPEPLFSKLGILPAMRTHILAFVSTEFLTRKESILGFMGETFYGYQYGRGLESEEMEGIVEQILGELEMWGFAEKKAGVYRATKLGRRVSELYIDPASAEMMLEALPKVKDIVGILFVISNTTEMRPYSRIVAEAEDRYYNYEYLAEGEERLRQFSTALMLRDWMNEAGEQKLLIDYGETPGSLYAKLSNADWLLYSAGELAKLAKVRVEGMFEARVRVKYGIRKELLDLVRLEQVGRVRARVLFNNGIKHVSDLRKEGARAAVERLFGKEIGAVIMSQVASAHE